MGLLWAGGSQERRGLQEEQRWWLCLAWVPRASRVPLGKPRGLPGVSILACTAPGCPAEVPVVPDPCWQQERWPVKVACVLPAVHGCSCAPLLCRTLGTGSLCHRDGDPCSDPPPLWPLLCPQHTLKMLEPASTL